MTNTSLHGRDCPCTTCNTIRFNLGIGRPDTATRVAATRGVLTDQHYETAWATGVDPLVAAGFGHTPNPQTWPQVTLTEHQQARTCAEVHRLRPGIRMVIDTHCKPGSWSIRTALTQLIDEITP